MLGALDVLDRAKSLPALKTASAFRVLIALAPQLHETEFRTLPLATVGRATGLHRNRVAFALSQLVAAHVIERRRDPAGGGFQYRVGDAIRTA